MTVVDIGATSNKLQFGLSETTGNRNRPVSPPQLSKYFGSGYVYVVFVRSQYLV